MFSSYKSVFWICVIMAVFVYVPFDVIGFSTDVWIRLDRIREWESLGFPLREFLSAGQNYPFGHEMHWTRPLDFVGYIFAWPFIPGWGIKGALDMMAMYVPLLVLITGIAGYFYALRGYLTPKFAFFSFWLFFYGLGTIWGQATVGYYDHHVFHFTILMWVIACIGQSFLVESKYRPMIAAGLLTALGTWITAEFYINVIFVLVPYAFYWLVKNTSLKPLLWYLASMTALMLAALSFDHPMDGFLTLDFYRFSMLHVLLSVSLFLGILFLSLFFTCFKSTFLRRLIYAVFTVSLLSVVLIYFFADVLIVPMADPFIYHLWVVKVTEMAPATANWAALCCSVILPIIISAVMIIKTLVHLDRKESPFLLFLSSGLLFYAVMMYFHQRVGISVNAFFVVLMALVLKMVFYPREFSKKTTLLFLVFYALFFGISLKGGAVIKKMGRLGYEKYKEEYKQNPNLEMPGYIDEIIKQTTKDDKEISPDESENEVEKLFKKPEDVSYKCHQTKNSHAFLKKQKITGSIFSDIFEAPEILWETGKPGWGGPYHTIKSHKDFVKVIFDTSPGFETARRLFEKRRTQFLYMFNPYCHSYLFSETDNVNKMKKGLDHTFYFEIYYETKLKPDWVKRIYYDHDTGIKIFKIIEPDTKTEKSPI
ncbi:MAG: hypothetical protein LBU87_07180 [Lactobacillales bacterium]|nr:hypothetical protein [Lactobacillales bacterium]